MCSSGINTEGELRRQPANPGSPGKWPFKMQCVKAAERAVVNYSTGPAGTADNVFYSTLILTLTLTVSLRYR